jgi:hypothetical protein
MGALLCTLQQHQVGGWLLGCEEGRCEGDLCCSCYTEVLVQQIMLPADSIEGVAVSK